tara:strand:+ start:200 stop:676 length:477 start_codon:yes stop_codon:yes gene_type:complete
MSDRFYTQQLEATGWCPGYRGTKTIAEYQTKFGKIRRKRKMAWTDESKAQAVEMYTAEEPTPETSMEVVKMVAEELGESPNGVRMILTKAGVYVKKAPGTSASSNGSTGSKRVSKVDAQQDLTNALSDAGQEIDEDIISKLTGKAAVYFTGVINNINN